MLQSCKFTLCMLMRYPIFSPPSFGLKKPYFSSIALFSLTRVMRDSDTSSLSLGVRVSDKVVNSP